MKKILSFVIALFVLMASSFACYADGSNDTVENANKDAVNSEVDVYSDALDDYSAYLERNKDLAKEVEEVSSSIKSVSAGEDAVTELVSEFEGKSDVLKWNDGSVTFAFNVSKDGLYNLAIDYYALEPSTKAIEFSLLVDGAEPFEGVANISLPRIFADAGEVRKDGMGNEFAPEQNEIFDWQEKRVTDIEGLNAKPYLFALKAGKHTVTLYDCNSPIAIAGIKLCAEEKIISYADALKKYEEQGYKKYDGKQIDTGI